MKGKNDLLGDLCKCGCRQEVKSGNIFILGHQFKGLHHSEISKNKISMPLIGIKRPYVSKRNKENNPMKHLETLKKHKKAMQSPEVKTKMIGRKCPYLSERNKKQMGENNPMFGRKRPEQSERMKNGLASYALSFNKNPSKPQVELFQMVKHIFLGVKLNHSCLNYSIDVAIPSLKIALEYDEPYCIKMRKQIKKDK